MASRIGAWLRPTDHVGDTSQDGSQHGPDPDISGRGPIVPMYWRLMDSAEKEADAKEAGAPGDAPAGGAGGDTGGSLDPGAAGPGSISPTSGSGLASGTNGSSPTAGAGKAREPYTSPPKSRARGTGILNFFQIGDSPQDPDTSAENRTEGAGRTESLHVDREEAGGGMDNRVKPGVVAPFIPKKSRSMNMGNGLEPGDVVPVRTTSANAFSDTQRESLEARRHVHASGAPSGAGAHTESRAASLDVPRRAGGSSGGGGLEVSMESSRFSIGLPPPPRCAGHKQIINFTCLIPDAPSDAAP